MHFPPRRHWLVALLVTLSPCHLVTVSSAKADVFDYYTNPALNKVPGAEGTQELKEVPQRLLSQHDRVLTNVPGAFLVVKTNQGRNAKLLVHVARQRIDEEHSLPILLIERYVTFREGEERTVEASGKDLSLFPGFRLSLDLGQVVPAELGGDLRFVVEGDKIYTQPLGKARLYLVTKPLPGVVPRKGSKLVVGDTFEPRYFNGTYKLSDDGRRSGTLNLKVDEDGSVSGAYYSDKDGRKYEVQGKVGMPRHSIQFTIKFPRSEQTFQGFLFTGDGQYLTGSSRLAEREAGFYARRVEE
jgi:hypothetical protein